MSFDGEAFGVVGCDLCPGVDGVAYDRLTP